MSELQLERSVLEAKEREELFAIADALGTKPTARAKKSDLVTQILRATGVDEGGSSPAEAVEKPKRTPRARKVAAPAAVAAPTSPSAPPPGDSAVAEEGSGSASSDEPVAPVQAPPASLSPGPPSSAPPSSPPGQLPLDVIDAVPSEPAAGPTPTVAPSRNGGPTPRDGRPGPGSFPSDARDTAQGRVGTRGVRAASRTAPARQATN